MTKERTPERKQQRRSGLLRRGPLHIPEYLLDKNYKYRFVNSSIKSPYKLEEKMQLGYQMVLRSELKELGENPTAREFLEGSTSQGAYVTRGVGDGITAYLMKIPVEVHEELQQEKREIVDELEDTLRRKAKDSHPSGGVDYSRK